MKRGVQLRSDIFAVDRREHDEGSRKRELDFSCTNFSLKIETSALALYVITSVASSEPHSSCNLQIPGIRVTVSHSQP